MKTYKQLMQEARLVKEVKWNPDPKIGWWLDNDPVTFYHGTHVRNLEGILEKGIFAAASGPTAGWISLALEPFTAYGYASMSGSGGESGFRAAGAKAVVTPPQDRVVFIVKLPQRYFLPKMAEARGHMDAERNKLKDRKLYDNWKRTDQEYYQITEIRLPGPIEPKYIVGYMFKEKR